MNMAISWWTTPIKLMLSLVSLFALCIEVGRQINHKLRLPSGNPTWQWKMDHLSVIFLTNPPFHRGFPLPCLITRGYQLDHIHKLTVTYAKFTDLTLFNYFQTPFFSVRSTLFLHSRSKTNSYPLSLHHIDNICAIGYNLRLSFTEISSKILGSI